MIPKTAATHDETAPLLHQHHGSHHGTSGSSSHGSHHGNNNNNNKRHKLKKKKSAGDHDRSVVSGRSSSLRSSIKSHHTLNSNDTSAAHPLDTASPSAGRAASQTNSWYTLQTWSRNTWLPGAWDIFDVPTTTNNGSDGIFRMPPSNAATTVRTQEYRSVRRRLFLLLTEPDTSLCSALFFWFLMLGIVVMNTLMMLQTLRAFQYQPDDCLFCGGPNKYLFEEEGVTAVSAAAVSSTLMYSNKNNGKSGQSAASTTTGLPDDCICAPTPFPWTDQMLQYLIYCFTAEWILRVVCYAPGPLERAATGWGRVGQFLRYLFSWPMVLDFWATFPYYMEFADFDTNGLMSLRLLRLFRVFQLVRLGSYNVTFNALFTVLSAAMAHLQILAMMLLFGAALFGSLLFWLEKGTWQYYPPTDSYEFVRVNDQHETEISPFTSIPETFYWFMVTATTVGYGDVYPVTNAGRWVAVLSMLLSVLVIAFPVSVFSDLWSKELERVGAVRNLEALASSSTSSMGSNEEDRGNDDDNDGGGIGGDLGPDNLNSAPSSGNVPTALMVPTGQDINDESFALKDPLATNNDTNNPIPAPIQTSSSTAPAGWNYGYQHAPQVLAAATGQPEQQQQQHHHHHGGTHLHLPDDPNALVVMAKDDVMDLLRYSQSIAHSQKQMQLIMRKYKLSM